MAPVGKRKGPSKSPQVTVERFDSMNSVVQSVINNQTAQTLAMSFLTSLISGKKNDNRDSKKEIEELKKTVENLTKEKELKNKELLQAKDRELEATIKKNEALQNDVQNMKRKLKAQQKAGTSSSDAIKEKEDLQKKILQLEKEKEEIQASKKEKEKEAEALKIKTFLMKEDNKELNEILKLIYAKEAGDDAGTSGGKSEEELINLLQKNKLFKSFVENQKPKEKGNSGKYKNKNSNQNLESVQKKKNSESSSAVRNQPKAAKPSTSNNVQHPPNNASHSVDNVVQHPPIVAGPSQQMPHMVQPMTVHYPHMPQQHPNYMPNYYGPPGPPVQHWVQPNFNQNLAGPPLHMPPTHGIPPLMNVPHSTPSQNQSFKPNIASKPNNLGNKFTNVKPSVETKNEKDGKKNKSGSSKDMWSELEVLKQDMNDSNSSRQSLCDRVSNMMTQASNCNVASKEKFMGELADCLKIINRMPEKTEEVKPRNPNYKGRNYIPNYKGDGWDPRKSSDGGLSQQVIIPNSMSDNDDVSSLCSEPATNHSVRGGKPRRDYRGFKKFHNPRREQKDRNKTDNQGQNEVSDDNNCSGDDAASVCSERSYNRNFHGRGGRGKSRGGHGHFRGYGKPKKNGPKLNNSSNNVSSSEQINDLENTVEVDKDSSQPSAASAEQTKKKRSRRNKNDKKDAINVDDVAQQCQDSLTFDDDKEDSVKDVPEEVTPEKSVQTKKGYAGADLMMTFCKSIPTLQEAIAKKINVTLKVENYLLVATEDGTALSETPKTLLDIIQFKQYHPNGVCLPKK